MRVFDALFLLTYQVDCGNVYILTVKNGYKEGESMKVNSANLVVAMCTLGIGVNQLAKASGIQARQISGYCNGKVTNVNAKSIQRLANALGVDVTVLLVTSNEDATDDD